MQKSKMWKFTSVLALVSLGITGSFFIANNSNSSIERSGLESSNHTKDNHVVFNEHLENELEFPPNEVRNNLSYFNLLRRGEERYTFEEKIKRKKLINADLTPEITDTFGDCFVSNESKLIGLTWKGRNEENFLPIPSYINEIGANAFRNCFEPKNIFIPNWVEKIHQDAFSDLDQRSKYYVFNETNKQNLLNSKIDRKQIFQVAKHFVYQEDEIIEVTPVGKQATTITIPHNIHVIGYGAFFVCPKLETVNILGSYLYGSVRHISGHAFSNCKSLKNINLPDGLVSIGLEAFVGCDSLETIRIPESVSYICYDAFRNCSHLKNVINNSSVLFDWWVHHHDYHGQTLSQMAEINLTKFTNSQGKPFTIIAERSFLNCHALKKLIISNDIQTISEYAFCHCELLTNLEIPYGVQWLGNWAFKECKSLTKVTIFNDCLKLGLRPFQNCPTTAKIYVFNKAAKEALAKEIFHHEQEIILINHFIFDQKILIGLTEEGKRQTTIIIPYGVIGINGDVFHNCSVLKTIFIPSSVKVIGSHNPFQNCPCLESVYYCNKP